MWFIVISSVIAVFLSYLSQFKGKDFLFRLSFIFITVIAAIHYDYGTDYMTYYSMWYKFQEMRVYSFASIFIDNTDYTEPGWIVLNILFGFKNGFFAMVALLNIIQNYIYYRLIKDYVPKNGRWMAMFIYLFMDSLYLINFSMMRQGFTVSLFVAFIMLMNKRKYLFAIPLIILAITIHASSVICIPFVALYFISETRYQKVGLAVLFAFGGAFLVKDQLAGYINAILKLDQLSKYGYSTTLGGIGLGYLFAHIPNAVILYAIIKNKYFVNKIEKVMGIISCCDILLLPLMMTRSAMIGRIGCYFFVFQIAIIPMLYNRISSKSTRLLLTSFLVFIIMYNYIGFFQNPSYSKSFGGEFHTIFSVI